MFYLRESVLYMRTYFIYIIRKCFIYVKIVQYIRGMFYVFGYHIYLSQLFINLKSCIIFDTAIIYILTNVILSGSARYTDPVRCKRGVKSYIHTYIHAHHT